MLNEERGTRVSFVIPHKGREELLERTLRSIARLDWNPDTIEIVIATQNPTLDCLHRHAGRLKLSAIHRSEHETISTLRNEGVACTTGEYLAFLDADIELSPDWLAVGLKALHERRERVLVSAVQRCAPDAGVIERIRVALNFKAGRTVQFVDGRNLLTTRATFQQAGGFPEHLVTCEDYYFTNMVARLGEVYVTDSASYVHLGEDRDFRELFLKEIWRGQSNLHSLRGRKITAHELPSILTPIWQDCLLVLAVAALAAGSPAGGGVLLAMAGVPTLSYAMRLVRRGSGAVGWVDALRFYITYHLARAIGTPLGVCGTIRHESASGGRRQRAGS